MSSLQDTALWHGMGRIKNIMHFIGELDFSEITGITFDIGRGNQIRCHYLPAGEYTY
ncbi:MAG: hypothetical protein JXB60_09155 [Candidatus Cloacimonetes bacterium]|nr:hypothetical protein [Candidatus Cloacimonadota bacterium]